MSVKIITHRGFNPDVPGAPFESSEQAFKAFLEQGWGLEFDVQFTADNRMIATHDANLKRITRGKDERKIRDVDSKEILALCFDEGNNLTTVQHVLEMIARTQSQNAISAFHLKALWQDIEYVDVILEVIEMSGVKPSQMIVFDAKPETAKYIHSKMPDLSLAASVSHPYDIQRYNTATGGTLISLGELIALKGVYTWAWIDEWDIIDENGKQKTFCNAGTFKILRDCNIKIAVVSPELHATSPMLYGGESHEDGIDKIRFNKRLKEIIKLKPDAICTDHPDQVQSLI